MFWKILDNFNLMVRHLFWRQGGKHEKKIVESSSDLWTGSQPERWAVVCTGGKSDCAGNGGVCKDRKPDMRFHGSQRRKTADFRGSGR